MKITGILISLVFIILFPLQNKSQNLPNFSFEEWAADGTFNNPVSWGTSNFSVFSIVTFNTVFKETTNIYSGTSSAKLVTVEKNVAGDNVKVAGLITLGHFDVNLSTRKAEVSGGLPMTAKPTKLSGYYKYSTPGIDSCVMSIYLTKFNTSTSKADTLATGMFSSGTVENWTYFEAPIEYRSIDTPDTMNIIILSSDTSLFVPGSTLFIDQLAIDAITSVFNDKVDSKNYSVFPNPATDVLNILVNSPLNTNNTYSIYNSSGVNLKSSIITRNHEIIDLKAFSSGIYFIELRIDNQKYLEKLIVN